MSIGVPTRLANGVGNWPDAQKWMDDYDYLTALIFGNFSLNGGMELWNAATSFSNPADAASVSDSWLVGKSGTSAPTVDVSREATIIDSGVYSMKLNITGAGSANSIFNIHQSLLTPTRFASETILLGVRCRASTANKLRCKIYDGVNSSYSTYHTGGSSFELLTAQLAVSSTPTEITLTVEVNPSDFTGALYIDSIFLFVVPSAISTTARNALAYTPLNAGFLPLTGGILTGAVDFPDGSVTIPAIGFSADSNTGLYRIGADNLGFTTGGVLAMELTSTQRARFVDGAVGTPAISFSADTDCGLYRITTNSIGLATNGSLALSIGAAQQVAVKITNSAAAPDYSWIGDEDTGFYRAAANTIDIVVGGNTVLELAAAYVYSVQPIYIANGLVGTPSLTFQSDTNTGIYHAGADDLAIVANGALVAEFGSNLNVALRLDIRDGTTGSDLGWCFHSDTDCGAFKEGTNQWGLSSGGTRQILFYSSGIQIYAAVMPNGNGNYNLGTSGDYWNDVSYKTLTDRGCLGWFDDGVELQDGSVVSDCEALLSIQKHPTKKTIYGVAMMDYTTFPKVSYKPATHCINDPETFEETQVEVLRDKNGDPYCMVKGEVKKLSDGIEMTSMFSIMIGAIKELTTRVGALEGAKQ